MTTPEDAGTAFVVLTLVFAAAALVRRNTPILRSLFIPTAVIGGFLMLALGPEGIGRVNDSNGLFKASTVEVWTALPGLLVNLMCAAMLLGERLPSPSKIWNVSAPHAVFAGVSSFGQFAIGSILVLFLLEPVFDMSPLGGAMIEVAYAGGHGTVAGLTGALEAEGAGELADMGLGLATIGLISAVIVGTLVVNYAVRSGNIPIARDAPTEPADDYDIDHHQPGPDDAPLDPNKGMTQVTAAFVFLGVSIGIAIVLLAALRWIATELGSTIFDNFPLFPFTIVGGVLVQIAAVKFDFEWAVNRQAVEGIGGLATDGVVICAIGTLSLSALGDNIGPMAVLAVASGVWSLLILFVFGKRFFHRNWFEHSITEFGETQGNVATGFMMLDMVDPDRKTDAVYGYSYRQLITRPLIGGGLISAASIPFIVSQGLTVFAVVAVAVTALLAIWGISMVRNGRTD